MDRVRLGKTNLMVSRLGFGGIPIQRVSEEEAIEVVRRCLQLGIDFIDTANGYSTSEERIGKAVAGKRSEVIIATKTGARTREDAEKHLKLSLQRLNTDYIDIWQFHGVSDFKALDAIVAPSGPLSVAREAHQSGIIRHIGITSHQIDVAKKAVQTDLFETLMFPFNFITYEAIDELIPLCRTHDVGFIAMKPLAGGMLDQVSIAFKYLLEVPDVVPLVGIEKVPEIEQISRILEGPLTMTKAENTEMQQLRKNMGTRFCHRCDYCQPCTQQIPISMIMTARSFFKRLPPERVFGEMVAPGMEKAANCSNCGECEKRCPYHLPIRGMIAEQVEWYNQEKQKYLERTTKK
jgi:uncharacterized protein